MAWASRRSGGPQLPKAARLPALVRYIVDRIFAANGTPLEDGALLAVGRAYGTRMVGFLGPGASGLR